MSAEKIRRAREKCEEIEQRLAASRVADQAAFDRYWEIQEEAIQAAYDGREVPPIRPARLEASDTHDVTSAHAGALVRARRELGELTGEEPEPVWSFKRRMPGERGQ